MPSYPQHKAPQCRGRKLSEVVEPSSCLSGMVTCCAWGFLFESYRDLAAYYSSVSGAVTRSHAIGHPIFCHDHATWIADHVTWIADYVTWIADHVTWIAADSASLLGSICPVSCCGCACGSWNASRASSCSWNAHRCLDVDHDANRSNHSSCCVERLCSNRLLASSRLASSRLASASCLASNRLASSCAGASFAVPAIPPTPCCMLAWQRTLLLFPPYDLHFLLCHLRPWAVTTLPTSLRPAAQ
mmetsp:Transcript_95935/g.185023  ORF Transcript_95935/g.185023 Transcript_95935/m.185023 type:complete len:244 (-) Transcript_95935:679-1410(-)